MLIGIPSELLILVFEEYVPLTKKMSILFFYGKEK